MRSDALRALLLAVAAVAASFAGGAGGGERALAAPAPRAPDVRYEPSEPEVVQAMLELGRVHAGDVVYDLGCGDGRIVIAAARQAGARGVCVDIDPRRIAESRKNARAAGVSERIAFRNEDLLETDIGDATVVMLFLSSELNLRLKPRLLRELKPGTRVVSHWHDMGDWAPQESVYLAHLARARHVYLWIVPERR
jgi:SAM-dependent methyltransferase